MKLRIDLNSQHLGLRPLMTAECSMLLGSLVNGYLRTDPRGKAAQVSAEQAQAAFPRLVMKLAKFLEGEDFKCQIIEYRGYRHNIDASMANFLLDKKPGAITHAVIQINQMAIDPCRLRMGVNYPLPLSYPIKDAIKLWDSFTDRTSITKLTSAELAERVAKLKAEGSKALHLGQGHTLSFEAP